MQEEILKPEDYCALYEADDEEIRYKTMTYCRSKHLRNEEGKNEKHVLSEQLLCLYSSKRARKDAEDRKRLVQRAGEMLESGSYNDKRGAKKYLKMEGERPQGLDLERIERDGCYDGNTGSATL
ncbi:hypothetical protein EDM53_02210 [Rickettsiales endosymbiont of Peranema trichophorum]|uniref:hypothetical protein n=1 Tax=Rickettsiales endosymbiont of Peranema trichophorum TaxID=2486577 RepID=UPI001023E285|nr:hypothetical protein [Rickettsiales endosymbiont of Peranema trichophorum]RZI47383.1 hypothetical protein EDM53_02210 [Rickettsiales endosymbiont of Peranema trichophorum]